MSDPSSGSPTIVERLHTWLEHAVRLEASDLHLVADYSPALRIHGDLQELAEPRLGRDELRELAEMICSAEQLTRLVQHKNVDFSHEQRVGDQTRRFRASLFLASGSHGACFRVVPAKFPTFSWAEFPESLAQRLAQVRDGLVIVTGSTGSGKSTTLAMIVNLLNQAGGYRIITVEEPIEYVFPRAAHSLVTQREVGTDVQTFGDGLKYGLRQDPDVILVGEIRDLETAQMALSAAETGHLVFTTLHTRDAKGAISRYTDLFPQEAQRDIRSQLALSLRAVVAQRLLPDLVRGEKRHLAIEVLWNTHPIAASIRNGKLENIDNYLVTNRDDGMISFDESVRQLLRDGYISREVAEQNVRESAMLNR